MGSRLPIISFCLIHAVRFSRTSVFPVKILSFFNFTTSFTLYYVITFALPLNHVVLQNLPVCIFYPSQCKTFFCIKELLFVEVFRIKLFKNNNFYSKKKWFMNCSTAHFLVLSNCSSNFTIAIPKTLSQYLFGTFHIVLSIYFVHFIRIFLPYSLQNCILSTSEAANFIPDTIILNLEPWHLSFIGFIICPHSLMWDNIRSIKLSN